MRLYEGNINKIRSGSISRVLSWTIISLGRQLLAASARSTRESDGSDETVMDPISSLLDLAPGGVYLATAVTCNAGALLPHRFTLTCAWMMRKTSSRPSAVCFLLHWPDPRGRWVLPTTVSCGARTFLHELGLTPLSHSDRLTHS